MQQQPGVPRGQARRGQRPRGQRRRRVGFAISCASVWAISQPLLADDAYHTLLNAETLASWTIEGQSRANFRFEDGVLIGQPAEREPRNSFLCSPREYKDFDVELEFKISPPELNSGLQFRSRVGEDGIVRGPQLEHSLHTSFVTGFWGRSAVAVYKLFSDLAWSPVDYASGGIYDEGGDRGWIFPGVAGGEADDFGEQGERLSNRTGWNRLRLEAHGPEIRTWFNGELRAQFSDPALDVSGRLCFQIHGGEYEDPAQYEVRWRNLRIRGDGS